MANLLNFFRIFGFSAALLFEHREEFLSVFNFFEHSGIFDGLRCGAFFFHSAHAHAHVGCFAEYDYAFGGELACQQVADLSCHAFLHLQPSGEDVDRACDFA